VRRVAGQVVVRPLYETPPGEAAALAALRRAALGNPFLVGNLVSRDGRAAVVVVEPEPMTEREFLRRDLDRTIERVAREAASGARVIVAGPPVVKAVTARMLVRDLSLAGPGTFVCMALVALLTFRTARGVLVPMATIAVAQLWTIGGVVLCGRSLTLVTSIVPPLVNTVGFAYVVHVVAEHDAVLRARDPRAGPDGVALALRRVSFPVFMCALTTALGCLSLCTSLLPVIREFGLFSALGVASAFLASMTVAPALLALLPSPAREADERGPRPLEGLAGRIAAFDVRNSGAILLVTAVLALAALAALPRIRVSTSLVSNFREGHPIRDGIDTFDRMFDGSMTLRAVIEGGARDAFKEPANLRVLEATQRWIEAQPEVGGTTSLADHVKTVSRAFRGGDTEASAIPESRRLVAQLLHFLRDERLESMVDRRLTRLRSWCGRRRRPRGIGLTSARGPPGSRRRCGLRHRKYRDDRVDHRPIAISQALNLTTASISIGLPRVYFRSVRLGLLALVPNMLPVLAFFALGLSGIAERDDVAHRDHRAGRGRRRHLHFLVLRLAREDFRTPRRGPCWRSARWPGRSPRRTWR
jgi:predicted RND superfamily exporter protein